MLNTFSYKRVVVLKIIALIIEAKRIIPKKNMSG